ncbi:MAG TPA: hypothetical protein ENO22_10095 [candidate division Zixibacteria bacterium]|nr:hypothetical protein [candidate division Zixibacteria bacterium]HEQ99678.1 hypothetical protein [candidate division Zixibacteria bacterium]
MVAINYANKEVSCKIVYYGPGLSGKTTNLIYIHSKVPGTTRGDLISLATDADRTLYFDFLPINIGTINGFTTRFQLYTVPGQVFYNATRKLVLRGVDGLIFVADSQRDKADENVESLNNLIENLQEYGYDLDKIPMVLQYNKRDLPDIMSIEELNQLLNSRNWPVFESSAHKGTGVFDTLKLIIKMILEKAKKSDTAKKIEESKTEHVKQPSAEQPVPQTIPKPSEPQTDKIPIQKEPEPEAQRPAADSRPDSPAPTPAPRPEPEHSSFERAEPVHTPERSYSEPHKVAASAESGATAAALADRPQTENRENEEQISSRPTNEEIDPGPDEGFEENVMADNGTEEAAQAHHTAEETVKPDVDQQFAETEAVPEKESQSADADEEPEDIEEVSAEEPEQEDAEVDEEMFELPSNRPKMAASVRLRQDKKKKKGFFLFRLFGKK